MSNGRASKDGDPRVFDNVRPYVHVPPAADAIDALQLLAMFLGFLGVVFKEKEPVSDEEPDELEEGEIAEPPSAEEVKEEELFMPLEEFLSHEKIKQLNMDIGMLRGIFANSREYALSSDQSGFRRKSKASVNQDKNSKPTRSSLQRSPRCVYVGNLAYNVTEELLYELMVQAGPISDILLVLDKDTKASKGFGFVEYDDDVSASYSIQLMDGVTIYYRSIRVRPSEMDSKTSQLPNVDASRTVSDGNIRSSDRNRQSMQSSSRSSTDGREQHGERLRSDRRRSRSRSRSRSPQKHGLRSHQETETHRAREQNRSQPSLHTPSQRQVQDQDRMYVHMHTGADNAPRDNRRSSFSETMPHISSPSPQEYNRIIDTAAMLNAGRHPSEYGHAQLIGAHHHPAVDVAGRSGYSAQELSYQQQYTPISNFLHSEMHSAHGHQPRHPIYQHPPSSRFSQDLPATSYPPFPLPPPQPTSGYPYNHNSQSINEDYQSPRSHTQSYDRRPDHSPHVRMPYPPQPPQHQYWRR